MDATKIEKFIDAGYTKEEINLLFKDPKIDPQGEAPDPQGEASPEQNKNTQEEAPDPMDDVLNTIKSLTDTVSALSDTVKALQNANIKNANTDKPHKDSIAEVMKSFVDGLN